MNLSLAKRRIVIIGGSSGMGLATAKAAVDAGAKVIIASRSRRKLDRAVSEISGEVESLTLDVRDEAAVIEFFRQVGKFDHLTTPGSEVKGGSFLTRETEAARDDFDSKFWGQYVAAKHGTPMIRPGGSIVFFAGIYSQRPPAGVSALAAINSGIEGLTRALAVELAPIRVNAVSPGLVDTPIYAALPETEKEALFGNYAQTVPVRHVGRPEEVAHAVFYLMANSFTSGSTIYVDGGFTLR